MALTETAGPRRRPRLRRSDMSVPGITRRGAGRGFAFYDPDGTRITDRAEIARLKALAVPPAYRDVWISPWPDGHVQAVGTDAAGRRQYRYHPAWRRRRDREKHERVLAFARRLPRLRATVARHLADAPPLGRDQVLAAAVRLLELGLFRVGGESYAEDNDTYGLATLQREHAVLRSGRVVFDYPAKGGLRRVVGIDDPEVVAVVRALRRRRRDGQDLLAYRSAGGWHDVRAEDVNAYLREVSGTDDITAKDFRTWHATVLTAVALALAGAPPDSGRGRARAVTEAVEGVAEQLGNTPTVCRASYVDPRVIEEYESGRTVRPTLDRWQVRAGGPLDPLRTLPPVERAVLRLLSARGS